MRVPIIGALGHLVELACHEVNHAVYCNNLVPLHRTLEPHVLLSLHVHVEQLVHSELSKNVLAQLLLLKARPQAVEDLIQVKTEVLALHDLSDDLSLASD